MPRRKVEGAGLYRALEPFSVVIDGAPVSVGSNEVVDENDPLYQAHPDKFGPVRVRSYSRVEQATAAPGEKR